MVGDTGRWGDMIGYSCPNGRGEISARCTSRKKASSFWPEWTASGGMNAPTHSITQQKAKKIHIGIPAHPSPALPTRCSSSCCHQGRF